MTEYKVLEVKMERLATWADDGEAAGYLWKTFDMEGTPRGWWLGCCKCGVVGGLSHRVTVDDEGRPTVDPSIVCGYPGCGAHYYIRQGKVIPV